MGMSLGHPDVSHSDLRDSHAARKVWRWCFGRYGCRTWDNSTHCRFCQGLALVLLRQGKGVDTELQR